MKPDQTVFAENKINLMVVIRISRSPSVVVEVAVQKMSLRTSVLSCISQSSLLFPFKNSVHAARLSSSESTSWNLKTTLRARYGYVNAQTRCWAVFTLVIERYKHFDLTSRYVVLSYSWNLFCTARSHCLPRGHMTSNSQTVSRQNLLAGNITKSMTSKSNSYPVKSVHARVWSQAFISVASALNRRSISRQTPHAEKTSGFQGTKWPVPSKDKSTCKISFERRGLLPWRLLNRGTRSSKWKMVT